MPSFWSLYIYGTLAVLPSLMNFFYRLLFQTAMKIKFLLQNDPILRILFFNAFVRSWAKIATSARHALFVLAPRHTTNQLGFPSFPMACHGGVCCLREFPTDIVNQSC
ncbi:hypothetical protein ARMGADRAFT_696822 [Armillaria gallica]|uniref:Uncharacterized protein n=1 Tax=Armillaria gallica TaxID=47427 RepID=A0A2H3DMK1_ARMGA|nr:hypothetical protein ARMGADRAFT_696822 [Armillaria gallica]